MSEVEFRKTYRGTWFAVLMVIVAFGFGLWLQGCRTQADLKSEPTATKYGERTKYDGHQNCSINRMLERIDVLEDRVEYLTSVCPQPEGVLPAEPRPKLERLGGVHFTPDELARLDPDIRDIYEMSLRSRR